MSWDSLVAGTVAELLEHARHEFHDDSLPIVISGHSLGADCAAWTVAHVQIRNLAGLLMLSPTRRSHLYATVRDRAFLGEPTEPGSYAASEMIPLLPAGIPVVVMRGDNDSHNIGDRDLVRAIIMSGHATSVNMAYKKIPLAGHSLRSLVIVGPVIVSVLDNIVDLWYSSRHLSHP
jgi:hypothetical protein